jgi:hypothetical protein
MEDCKPAQTPIASDSDARDEKRADSKLCDRSEYRSIVGSLIYASVISRPDIAYAVSKVGQHMANPTAADMVSVKRILRYLRGTIHYTLVYRKNGSTELVGYSDADWGGDISTRRSTGGYVFLLAGAAISWCSKRQQTVALSSTESEYMALCAAIQEAIYLKALLTDLKYVPIDTSVEMQVDNQSAMRISVNNITSNRTKHIDVRYHFCREKVQGGVVHLKYIPTEFMLADILTKAVGSNILAKLLPTIIGMDSAIMRLKEGVKIHSHNLSAK